MTNSRYSTLFVILCLFITIKSSTAYYSNSYGSSINYDFERKMEKKMDILLNEVHRLAKVNNVGKDISAANPVTVVSVSRSSDVLGIHTFTVFYTAHVEDDVFHSVTTQNNRGIETLAYHDWDEERPVLTFNCSDEERFVKLSFENRNKSSIMELTLNTTGSASFTQDVFTVPLLETNVISGDLVYYPGRDVRLLVTASSSPDHQRKRFIDLKPSLNVFLLSSPYSGNSMEEYTSSNKVWITNRKQFVENTEYEVTIFTSEHNMTGFLDLEVTLEDPDSLLVNKFKVKRRLVVRPTTLSGPYPEGYMRLTDVAVNKDLRERLCKLGETCTLACSAVGESVSSIDVYTKHTNDTSDHMWNVPWDIVENTKIEDRQYFTTVEWTVDATADADNMMFKCVAQDETNGNNITEIGDVTVYLPEFYINVNASRVDIETDENEPDYVNATLRCSVHGKPVREVWFEYRTSHNTETLYGYAQLESDGPTDVTATLDVMLVAGENRIHDTAELYQLLRQGLNPVVGNLTDVKCVAIGYSYRFQAEYVIMVSD